MKVIVYSTNACPWCIKAKQFLKNNKINFVEKNVGEDQAAAQEMITKTHGHMGVPVIDIDGQVIIGFNEPKLKEALGLK